MASESTKRWRSQKKRSFPDIKYPEVTASMMGSSSTPSKSKGKQLVVSSEESDADRSLGLKDILLEPEGLYWHTRTRTGIIALVDYSLLARGIKVNDEHSAIVESQSSNSSSGTTACAYMAGTPKEMAKQFEGQAPVQRSYSIWFEPRKNLSTPLSRCYHNCLRTKRNRKVKLLPRNLRANRRRGELIFCKYWEWRAF